MKRAIVLSANDTVATALETLKKGESISIPEQNLQISLKDDILFEHKFALYPIKKGDKVYKYGTPIGIAYQDIDAGQHVHLHNLKSLMVDGVETDSAILDGAWSNRI